MLPDRVSNPGPPTYESGVLPIALRGPVRCHEAVVRPFFCLRINSLVKTHIFVLPPFIVRMPSCDLKVSFLLRLKPE